MHICVVPRATACSREILFLLFVVQHERGAGGKSAGRPNIKVRAWLAGLAGWLAGHCLFACAFACVFASLPVWLCACLFACMTSSVHACMPA
eukprot:SAG11_NODE_3384_length_2482_cov_5.328997_1_plen_92_part_00